MCVHTVPVKLLGANNFVPHS